MVSDIELIVGKVLGEVVFTFAIVPIFVSDG